MNPFETEKTSLSETAEQVSSAAPEGMHTSPWRLVLQTALDAVVVMDRDGKVADWNDKASALFGWTRKEAIGRNMAELIIPPQYRDAHDHGLKRFLATGTAKVLGQHLELSGLTKTGEEIPVELSISSFLESDRVYFFGFLRGIRERKQAEKRRKRELQRADALFKVVSFAATSDSFERALRVCLDAARDLSRWPVGHIYLPSKDGPPRMVPSGIWSQSDGNAFKNFRALTEKMSFVLGEGLPGRIWESGEALWISDVDKDPSFVRSTHWNTEAKAALGFPIRSRGEIIAIIELFSDVVSPRKRRVLLTLQAMGAQAGRVFERLQAETELRIRAAALEKEVIERKNAEQHQKLLLAEVNHRVKNMLAVVSAVAAQTARRSSSIEDFCDGFLPRLQALSRTHTLLSANNWKTTDLGTLLKEILSPYYAAEDQRVELSGPSVQLTPERTLIIGPVLHELATNAAKYGALSGPEGRLSVTWSFTNSSPNCVEMKWCESSAHPKEVTERIGFGSVLIKTSFERQLGGTMKCGYSQSGISYEFTFPASE